MAVTHVDRVRGPHFSLPHFHDADVEARFYAAVPAKLRSRVRAVVMDPYLGGRGLRKWLALLTQSACPLPEELPEELVEIYLEDCDAEPLFDCAECGLALPVRAGRRGGHEPTHDRVYFAACPHCSGPVGPHAYCVRTCTR